GHVAKGNVGVAAREDGCPESREQATKRRGPRTRGRTGSGAPRPGEEQPSVGGRWLRRARCPAWWRRKREATGEWEVGRGKGKGIVRRRRALLDEVDAAGREAAAVAADGGRAAELVALRGRGRFAAGL